MTIESADSDEGAFVDGRGGHVSDDGLMWLADDGDVIFLSGEAAEDERFWADVVKTDAAERALFEATYLAVFPPKPGVDSRGDGDEWVGDRYTWHFSTPGRDPFTDVYDEQLFDEVACEEMNSQGGAELLEHEPIEVAFLVGRARGFLVGVQAEAGAEEQRADLRYEAGLAAGRTDGWRASRLRMRTIATRLLASAAVASALVVLIILAMPQWRFWLEFIGYAVVTVWLVGAFVGCVGLVVIYAKNAPTRRIQRGLTPKVPRAQRREAAALASLVEQWPAVVERIKVDSRVAWLGLKGSRPGSLHDGVLTVIAGDPGRATNFPSNDRWLDLLRECIREVTGLRVDVTVFDSERVTGARDGASQ